MSDQAPVIAVHSVVRRFGDTVALAGLDLHVQPGEVFGVLGHNGAGKTTLLRLVNGLLRPSAGQVVTFGSDAYEHGPAHRARTGVVTESTALDDFLTIRENLRAYGALAGRPRRQVRDRVEQLLEVFGIADQADRQARQLSAGLRQRAAFARGLVHDPELLLLDEPTANLDPVAARQVRGIVADLARRDGRTVVLSTHNLVEAQEVCDRIAVLREGRLQAVGTLQELHALTASAPTGIRLTTLADAVPAALAVAAGFGDPVTNGQAGVVEVQGAPGDRMPDLAQRLVAADVPIMGLSTLEPTLEDIYLALHHQAVEP